MSNESEKTDKKTYPSYKDSLSWQKGVSLSQEIYVLTSSFPEEEMYGLTTQLRQTSLDIPTLIARGYSLKFRKSDLYIQYLQRALASLAELETGLLVAEKLGFVDESGVKISESCQELLRIILGTIKKIRSQGREKDETRVGHDTQNES